MTTALVLYHPPVGDELFRRRGLLLDLRRKQRELEDEFRADAAKLRAFELRYKPAVGKRHDELESLREKIDRAWNALRNARRTEPQEGPSDEPAGDEIAASSFRPGRELRRLFHELARRIHPDLAPDAEERRRRHEFMAEATLAYRAGDSRRLQWLLEHWEAESAPIRGNDPHSLFGKTNRQIAWVRYRIRETHGALGELHASSLAELMRQADQARGLGRNLILEMRNRVIDELAAAHRDLERVAEAIEDLEPELARVVKAEAGL